MALLFQEYTMKPASRPFGCSMLVAHVPKTGNNDDVQPELYCIDPSGSVESVTSSVVIGGLMGSLSLEFKEAVDEEIIFATTEKSQYQIVDLMRKILQKNSPGHSDAAGAHQRLTVLTAALMPGKDMKIRRHSAGAFVAKHPPTIDE
mmetsp:Transcript_11639/g.16304  ORF Transcript_11639/g.16304 Transcript_11639/m.16304 type:complete len:147 (+) Transcript_11639:32-472(+)